MSFSAFSSFSFSTRRRGARTRVAPSVLGAPHQQPTSPPDPGGGDGYYDGGARAMLDSRQLLTADSQSRRGVDTLIRPSGQSGRRHAAAGSSSSGRQRLRRRAAPRRCGRSDPNPNTPSRSHTRSAAQRGPCRGERRDSSALRTQHGASRAEPRHTEPSRPRLYRRAGRVGPGSNSAAHSPPWPRATGAPVD